MKNLQLLSLLFIFFGITTIQAQYLDDVSQGIFHHLTVEDGLSQNTVNCILKDKAGFIWIGTQNGLNRYDSHDVKILNKDLFGDFNSRNIRVQDLHEDRQGKIWIASDYGLIQYDPVYDNIKLIDIGENVREVVINCIEPENDSLLWLGTTKGLKLFQKDLGIIKEYKNEPYQPNSLSSSVVFSVCLDEDKLWVGTDKGLNVLNKQDEAFSQVYQKFENTIPLQENVIRSITKTSKGFIYIGTEFGGIVQYSKKTGEYVSINKKNSALPHNDVRDVYENSEGNLWLATNGGGVCLYNPIESSFYVLKHFANDIRGLTSNSIYSVIEDDEGILWVGTYAGGCNFNTSKINSFKLTKHQPLDSNSICQSSIRSIYLDKESNLWIGTLGGLSFYDSDTRKFKSYLSDESENSALSFNTVTSIYEDSYGKIWVGTYSGGLNLLNNAKTGFKRYVNNSNDRNSISGDNIYCIVEDEKRNLWIATSQGLNLYNRYKDNFERIGTLDIRDIDFLSDGKLVLATSGGFAIYDPERGDFTYNIDEKTVSAIVVSIYIEDDNNIWMCTQGNGLILCNTELNEYKVLKDTNGLPSNFINSIEPYRKNEFWISTARGLTLYNKVDKSFTNFGPAEGVDFYEFHPRSSTVLPDGSYAFGGSKGLIFFNPEQLLKRRKEHNVVFTSLRIDNKEIGTEGDKSPLAKNISFTQKLELKYVQKDVAFSFVDINFINPGYAKYAYKLESYMNDWSDIESQNSVAFTNLDPGDYQLKVRTIDNLKNADNTNEASILISIAPPFWQTWYFYLIITSVIILLLLMYKKYTFISIKLKNKLSLERMEFEQKEEFSKLRMRFFTYISHELRTPLSLIVDPLKKIMDSDLSEENRRYVNFVNKNTNRLLILVNQILDFRKMENDTLKLQVEEIDAVPVVREAYSSFSELAERKNIRYDLNVVDTLVACIDKDKLEKMMFNLLNNAFKFTPEGGHIQVELKIIDSGNNLSLIIKDSGVGMEKEKLDSIFNLYYQDALKTEKSKAGFGLGLSYIQRLVDLHHGKIYVKSNIGEGSTFFVELPTNKKEYVAEEMNACKTDEPQSELKIQEEKSEEEVVTIIKEYKTPEYNRSTPKVLIVEDELELQEYLFETISEKFQVYKASNGLEAIEIMKKNQPDIIISDNVMPEMDGIELCEKVKSTPEWQHIPFVFLSAWNSDDFKLNGLKTGATDYMSKPFDTDILLAKIDNILKDQQRVREISKTMFNVDPDSPEIETEDMKFIRRAQDIIEANIDNFDFNTKIFESKLNMSHALLYRKLKKLTGKSSNEFIREYRLKRAAQILDKDKSLTVSEVGMKVGHIDAKYFSQCFKKLYGVTPTEYKNNPENN